MERGKKKEVDKGEGRAKRVRRSTDHREDKEVREMVRRPKRRDEALENDTRMGREEKRVRVGLSDDGFNSGRFFKK